MGAQNQIIEPVEMYDFQIKSSYIRVHIKAPSLAPIITPENSHLFGCQYISQVTKYGDNDRMIYAYDCLPLQAVREYASITQAYIDIKNEQFNEEYE